MSLTPERRPALSRKSLLSILLLAACCGLLLFLLIPQGRSSPPSDLPMTAGIVAPPSFANPSARRVFLTDSDRAAAVERGLVPAGTRSIIATGGKLAFGSWLWDDVGVPKGTVTVRVDLKRQLVSAFQGPHEIGTAVVVYGIDGKETPRGKLPILGKTRDYHSKTYDAPMPFSLWLRGDGVALHGSAVALGKATNGCIGVPIGFAEKLFAVAQTGDVIEVIG